MRSSLSPVPTWNGRTPYFGRELPGPIGGEKRLREWFNQVLEPWESLHVEVEEITEAANDGVFYCLFLTGRGRGSGVDTELRVWAVNWFADGKVSRRRVFRERDEALQAAGLSE
jgi:ketosteroid isomerase-like protein